jgi:hypothetical protein
MRSLRRGALHSRPHSANVTTPSVFIMADAYGIGPSVDRVAAPDCSTSAQSGALRFAWSSAHLIVSVDLACPCRSLGTRGWRRIRCNHGQGQSEIRCNHGQGQGAITDRVSRQGSRRDSAQAAHPQVRTAHRHHAQARRSASIDELDRLAERILSAKTLREVFADKPAKSPATKTRRKR